MNKKCTECKTSKNILEYHKDKTHSDGRSTECKTCTKKKNAEYWRKNVWRLSKRNRGYKHSSPEQYQNILRQQRLYKSGNREAILLYAARKRARIKNLKFDLLLEDIKIPKFCPLLGIKILLNGYKNNRDSSPSIDRINPNYGYTKDNISIISYRANRIKNDASSKELEKIAFNLKRMQGKM